MDTIAGIMLVSVVVLFAAMAVWPLFGGADIQRPARPDLRVVHKVGDDLSRSRAA